MDKSSREYKEYNFLLENLNQLKSIIYCQELNYKKRCRTQEQKGYIEGLATAYNLMIAQYGFESKIKYHKMVAERINF